MFFFCFSWHLLFYFALRKHLPRLPLLLFGSKLLCATNPSTQIVINNRQGDWRRVLLALVRGCHVGSPAHLYVYRAYSPSHFQRFFSWKRISRKLTGVQSTLPTNSAPPFIPFPELSFRIVGALQAGSVQEQERVVPLRPRNKQIALDCTAARTHSYTTRLVYSMKSLHADYGRCFGHCFVVSLLGALFRTFHFRFVSFPLVFIAALSPRTLRRRRGTFSLFSCCEAVQ